MNILKNLKPINIISLSVVSLVSIMISYYIQFNPLNPYLPAIDSYYHVGMAELIRDQGIPTEFPWLYFTIHKDIFVDHQLLFHIFLIPFISLFGNILGAKIYNMVFFTLSWILFYFILKNLKVRAAAFLTIFSILTMACDFYFRLSLIRDMSLSLTILFLGFLFLLKNRYWLLGILSFLYVWAYGAFMFLPGMVLAYTLAEFLTENRWRGKALLFSIGGMILGLVINPYFPENINFMYTQVFSTGLGGQSYVGGEWHPYDTWYWVKSNMISICFLLGAILISYIKRYKIDFRVISLFVVTLVFMMAQWKAKRFVEYSSIFMSLSAILILKDFFREKWDEFQNKSFFKVRQNYFYLICFSLLMIGSFFFSKSQISKARFDTNNNFSMSALTEIHDYLKKHSEPGDIVFTDDWDVFPRNFFLNRHNYYVVGLDPEFMNQYDGPPFNVKEKLYKLYADISSGKDKESVIFLKPYFKAKWILIDEDHMQFRRNLKQYPLIFREVLKTKNNDQVEKYYNAKKSRFYLFEVL